MWKSFKVAVEAKRREVRVVLGFSIHSGAESEALGAACCVLGIDAGHRLLSIYSVRQMVLSSPIIIGLHRYFRACSVFPNVDLYVCPVDLWTLRQPAQ